MDDPASEKAKPPPGLAAAIRAARGDEAERSRAFGDLRGAEVARLSLLKEALEPVFSEVPADVPLFDLGLMAGGERPRLFIDMIAFVEMDRDRRHYRLLQDTRHGRVLLAESDRVSALVAAVTDYVARRLVEREQALASLTPDGTMRPHQPVAAAAPAATDPPSPADAAEPDRRGRWSRGAVRAARIAIDALGVVTLAVLVWIGVQMLQGRGPSSWGGTGSSPPPSLSSGAP